MTAQASALDLGNLPLTLRDSDLMAIVGLAHSAFYKRKARREFAFLELRPQLPNSNTVYSGHLVGQWLRGEIPCEQPRRFFGRATPSLVAKRPVGRPRKGDQSAAVLPHFRKSLQEDTDAR